MKLLVTGRTGQVATSLVERAQCFPMVELLTAGRPDLDLAILGSAKALIDAVRPDFVINTAAYTAVDAAEDSPDEAYRINADAAGEIAAACASTGARLIHLSTDYVFDGTSDRPYREDDPVAPLSVYGKSKLAGEVAVRLALPGATIVRTAWIYSPFGHNFVRTMVRLAGERDEVSVVDDQHGNPTSALDLADAILALAARWSSGDAGGEGEIYHLAGPDAISWAELSAKVMERLRALGQPVATVRPIPSADWPTKAPRPRNSTLDTAKYLRDGGSAMHSFDASLEQVIRRLVAA
ncbi:dTDP-4-dehydrorhamnose reductase [Sphingomonas sp. RB1R13]|uniref:dTDP-4-dehydrorhamnose reductase n=1 Tax=Sphingomonas sp. RB1R13 TaxID=3096159 RepID=UPI002FC5A22C